MRLECVVDGVWMVCVRVGVGAVMSNLPQAPPGNQFKPAPNPPGVTTPGIHTGEPYAPSNDKAWGPRGKWEGKAWTDVSFERQVSKTKCVVGYDGYIDDARCEPTTLSTPPWLPALGIVHEVTAGSNNPRPPS